MIMPKESHLGNITLLKEGGKKSKTVTITETLGLVFLPKKFYSVGSNILGSRL